MNQATVNPLTLPSLPLLERSRLPQCKAIYFALAGERVLYIGKSENLNLRWAQHHRLQELTAETEEVRIAWLECSDANLLFSIEAALIDYFQPPLNRSGRKAKARDPNYFQLRGHVRKHIAVRFKTVCSLRGIDFGEGMEEALEPWLEQEEKRLQIKTLGDMPETLAELVQQNFYQLLTDGKITPDNLKAIAAGEKPSNADLSQIAQTLDMREEDLVEMRDRTFPPAKRR